MVMVIVLSDDPKQKMALLDTLHGAGIEPLSVSSKTLDQTRLPKGALWLIDLVFDEEVWGRVMARDPKDIITGFVKAPYLTATTYPKWSKGILKALSNKCTYTPTKAQGYHPPRRDFKRVVFLGASMGGVDAVKAFLDALPVHLPITLILAQHFDDQMLESLPRLLCRHNGWRIKVFDTTQKLAAGEVLIAPTQHQVVFDGTRRALAVPCPWEGEYRPSIAQILKNLSEVYDHEFIGIVFSGMGSDGVEAIKYVRQTHARVWVQDPKSCQSPSQPQAILDSGLCHFQGTPLALAKRLSQVVGALG